MHACALRMLPPFACIACRCAGMDFLCMYIDISVHLLTHVSREEMQNKNSAGVFATFAQGAKFGLVQEYTLHYTGIPKFIHSICLD